jgi:hypothetical protein
VSAERIRLPADVEMEDRLAWGLTARQLGILAASALLAYAVFSLAVTAAPLPAAAALAAPAVLVGSVLAFGRKDGLSGDRLAIAAVRHLTQSPRRVAAPDGQPAPLRGAPEVGRVSLLGVPVKSIRARGVVELTDGTSTLLLSASGTSWTLRSPEEQAGLARAYGAWLNSLAEPTAVVVRSQHVDLVDHASAIGEEAETLPHASLQGCARAYAQFLEGLSSEGDGLRRRQILLVLNTRSREPAATRERLERRAAESTSLLASAGVELRPLDGPEALSLLHSALEAPAPVPGSQMDGVIHAC